MLAATGAGTFLPAGALEAQSPAPRRRIDIHSHIFPPFYQKEAREQILAAAANFPQLFTWTPQTSLDEMDRNGVAASALSVSTPGIWFGDNAQGRRLARQCNDYAAQMVRDYPGRFALFAAIPLPDSEGSLREIEYAFDTLKADGIGLLSSYANKWLGDDTFLPVFEELNRRKAVVFVHPNVANCCGNTLTVVQQGLIELLFDTVRAITGLLYSGTLIRYPDIRYVFCHGGGALAQMAERITAAGRNSAVAKRFPNGMMYEIRKLNLDVASMTSATSFNAVRDLVGVEKMLLGSDFPYNGIGQTTGGLLQLKLPAADLDAIERGNALSLLPRLRV